MSIGKSAIKRVENNGYSKVKTEAPDMENSTAVESEKPTPRKRTAAPKMEKKEPREAGVRRHNNSEKKPSDAEAPKTEPKPARKPAVRKKAEPKSEAAPEVKAEVAEPKSEVKTETASATEYYNICRGTMPIHLL